MLMISSQTMMIVKLHQLGTESRWINTLYLDLYNTNKKKKAGRMLFSWTCYCQNIIKEPGFDWRFETFIKYTKFFHMSAPKLFNLLFQPNRFLHLKLKLYIASSCGRRPNNSAPVIKTRIFIFCFTFCTVCNCVNKSQLSMEKGDENLMLSHLENGSAHSENNGAKQKRKFLLKGVSTEFSQH